MTATSQNYTFGDWTISCMPEDGARISQLSYQGTELLTTKPENFVAPQTDYGEYELRPVYGYDDCFPTVVVCQFPTSDWNVPDHGELCYLPWDVQHDGANLNCSVTSRVLPVSFARNLVFGQDSLTWQFEVSNGGTETVPLLHVMHPLMPLDQVSSVAMPAFTDARDTTLDVDMAEETPEEISRFLMSRPSGEDHMLLLHGVTEGKMTIGFKSGISVIMSFPADMFPTIGIWWNNNSYPNEDSCRRNECAFEPIPGNTSELTDAYDDNLCLNIDPGKSLTWEIMWRIVTG